MTDLKSKSVLVTGGAHGIGRKLVDALAAEGAHVIVTDINTDNLKATEEALRSAGRSVSAYVLDVTKPNDILSVRDRIHGEVGRIDILVNNAGIVFGGPFLEVPLEKHDLTYNVNVNGLVAMTHAFLPDLIACPSGHLVNIASASGLIGLPYGTTYASSKWAVIGFSESIRLELQDMNLPNVQVTTVCPSYIATGMFKGAKAPLLTSMLDPDKLVEKIVDAIKTNKPFLLEPALVKIVPVLKSLLPQGIFDTLAETLGVTSSMRQWKGHNIP
jgi:short-subunit dehydrogenase